MKYKFEVNGLKVHAMYRQEEVEDIFLPLLKKWTILQKKLNRRIFVFLAAPPGCGKTTLSLFLEYLSKQEKDICEIQAIGMDGFHYTNAYLNAHTFVEEGKILCLKDRKGNYVTFDKENLKKKIEEGRVHNNLWPIYSRTLHDPIEDKIVLEKKIVLIEGNYLLLKDKGWQDLIDYYDPIEDKIVLEKKIVLIEGNYLLLKDKGWQDLIDYCDYSVFIEAQEEELKERLISRKIAGGLSYVQGEELYNNSDVKNIRLVLKKHHKADLTLSLKNGKFTIK